MSKEIKGNTPPVIRSLPYGIVLALYECQEDMCRAFMRVQEFYENPTLAGIYTITREDVEEAYRPSLKGKRYEECFVGFNVPGGVFNSYFSQASSLTGLHEEETLLLEAIASELMVHDETLNYIIASLIEDVDTIDHEMAHALYHASPEYRGEMDGLIKNMDAGAKEAIYAIFASGGAYHQSVWDDELQANLATGLSGRLVNIAERLGGYEFAFREVFSKYKA